MPIATRPNTPLLACAFLAMLALAACNKPRMPNTPPQPSAAAENTQLRDAIKQPLDAAKAAAALEQQTAQRQRQQIDADTSGASPDPKPDDASP